MNVFETFPPVLVLAEASAGTTDTGIPWLNAAINLSALVCWIGYMVWRDRKESERQDKRHEDNLAAQKAVENAFRINTTSIIVGMAAAKNIDTGYAELLEKVRQENEAGKRP